MILCISMQWFREWESFVKGKDNGTTPRRETVELHVLVLDLFLYKVLSFSEPPGPIDNSKIGIMKGGHIQLKQGKPRLGEKHFTRGSEGKMDQIMRIFMLLIFFFLPQVQTMDRSQRRHGSTYWACTVEVLR